MSNSQAENKDRRKPSRLKTFFQLGEVGRYFFRRKNPDRPVNFNIRVMHGINRTAIIVFVLGIIYLVVKRCI